MKRCLFLGLVLSVLLILSSTDYPAMKDSKKVSRIGEVKSVLEQAQILTKLNEMTSTRSDGVYQYYKDNSSNIEKIRSFSMDDRTEIEILNGDGKWRLAQIRNNKTGVIAHYKNREFIEYTLELPEGTIAHYMDHPILDKQHYRKVDFFTQSTYFICSEKEVCLNSQKIALKINTNNAIRFIIKRPHTFFSKNCLKRMRNTQTPHPYLLVEMILRKEWYLYEKKSFFKNKVNYVFSKIFLYKQTIERSNSNFFANFNDYNNVSSFT